MSYARISRSVAPYPALKRELYCTTLSRFVKYFYKFRSGIFPSRHAVGAGLDVISPDAGLLSGVGVSMPCSVRAA